MLTRGAFGLTEGWTMTAAPGGTLTKRPTKVAVGNGIDYKGIGDNQSPHLYWLDVCFGELPIQRNYKDVWISYKGIWTNQKDL